MRAALLSMTLLLACGEKAAPPASSVSVTRTVSLIDIEIPGDAKSKDFAMLLLGTPAQAIAMSDTMIAMTIITSRREKPPRFSDRESRPLLVAIV